MDLANEIGDRCGDIDKNGLNGHVGDEPDPPTRAEEMSEMSKTLISMARPKSQVFAFKGCHL